MMLRFPKAGFGTFNSSRRAGPSQWTLFDLFHVRDGAMRLQVAGDQMDLPAGCGVLIFPGTPFYGDAITPRSAVGVQHFSINPKLRDSQLPVPLRRIRRQRGGYLNYRLEVDDVVERDIERIVEWHFIRPSAETHALREALLVLILGQIEWRREQSQQTVGGRHALDQLVQWMAERVDRDVTLAEMAEHAQMSASHFRAEFRKRFSQSPGAYFRELRLREAARRLRLTADPIKAIAHQLGFTDLPNFYRAFRLAHGFAPAVYRKRHAPTN